MRGIGKLPDKHFCKIADWASLQKIVFAVANALLAKLQNHFSPKF